MTATLETDPRSAAAQPPHNADRFRIAAFVVVAIASALLSLAWLAARNLYDDELTSFNFILLPLRQLWAEANRIDVHPPGMYALSRGAWLAIGDERWMTLLPLGVLYAGLIAFAWRVGRLITRTREAYVLFLLVCFLHPHLLMWGNSIRWYGWWTGLALLVTSLWIHDRRPRADEPSASSREPARPRAGVTVVAQGVLSGVLLAAMFYLNYLTLPFALALLVLAYAQDRSRKTTLAAAIAAVILIVAASPQLPAFWNVHRLNAAGQVGALPVAAMRLCHGMFLSEAMMPWTPAAIVFFVGVVAPLALIGAVHILRQRRDDDAEVNAAIVGVGGMFATLLLVALATGLGGKSRSFLVITPLLAVMLAAAADGMRVRWLRTAFVAITLLWIAQGGYNLLARQGTAKSGINDHPEEVVALLAREAAGKPAAGFTHDVALTYAINRAARQRGENWTVVSFYPDTLHARPRASLEMERPEKVFVVRSTIGSLAYVREQVEAALASAEAAIVSPRQAKLSPDPQAAMKRRIPGMGAAGGDVRDFRYHVTFGDAAAATDWPALARRFYVQLPGEAAPTPAQVDAPPDARTMRPR